MSLNGVQRFLTRYMRDPALRNAYREAECRDDVEGGFELTAAEREDIRGIDLRDLERAAHGIDEERRSKRESEFQRFFAHYRLYADMDAFFGRYICLHTTGSLSRPVEMERFLAYAIRHVTQSCFPRYLVDLARFDYHVVTVAAEPAQAAEGALESLPSDGLEVYHRVSLRKPARLVEFLFDAYAIAREEPCTRWASESPQPTKLAILKSTTHFKSSVVHYADAIPDCDAIATAPQSIESVIRTVADGWVGPTFARLEELFHEGVINVFGSEVLH